MVVIRMKDIIEMDAPTLKAKLADLSNELNSERGIVAAGGKATNAGRMKELRRTIARIHTVARERGTDLKKTEVAKKEEKIVEKKIAVREEKKTEKKEEKKPADVREEKKEEKQKAAVEKTEKPEEKKLAGSVREEEGKNVHEEKKTEAKVSKGIAEIGEV